MFRRIAALFLGLGLLLALGTSAGAGGLYLNEYGTSSMSLAAAGAEAAGHDAEVTLFNPAAMTLLEGNSLSVGAGVLGLDLKFDPASNTPVAGGDGGAAGGPGPILHLGYSHRITDDFRLGIDLTSISAALIDYDDDWTGRYFAQDVSLITLQIFPSLAWRPHKMLSIGGGPRVMWGHLKQRVALRLPPLAGGDGQVKLNGLTDWAVGGQVGILFEPLEGTRIGVSWFSKIDLDLHGTTKVDPFDVSFSLSTEVPLVQFVRAGLYQKLTDRLALRATIAWEDWSKFGEQVLRTDIGTGTIPRNWNDTWGYALGFEYELGDKWMLRLGAKYDTNPVSFKDRTPDMPIDRQIRIATGAQYQWNEKLQVGGSFVFADYGSAAIDQKDPQTGVIGDYKRNNLFFLAVYANWNWSPGG